MITRVVRAALLSLGVAASALVVAQPAMASGGGCTGAYPISACISQHGNELWADFYLNAEPDFTRVTAELWIDTEPLPDSYHQIFNLTYKGGPYGKVTRYIATLPPKAGNAVARVQVRTHDGTAHGLFQSPRIYWPAT
ncbi:hypothetical protein ACPCHT_05950 [Nucisporomicrobium flavum]|uniref:hypothetical protein n=1 Tax=Nucisporomicrobium flavum TaxID=2785915 RepID=UPI003C2DB028